MMRFDDVATMRERTCLSLFDVEARSKHAEMARVGEKMSRRCHVIFARHAPTFTTSCHTDEKSWLFA